jgi:hypothetical protein
LLEVVDVNASGRGSIPQHSEARQEATEDEYQDGNGDLAGFCRGDLLHESSKKLAALYVGDWLALEIANHSHVSQKTRAMGTRHVQTAL